MTLVYKKLNDEIEDIAGLFYIPDFITYETESKLLGIIDQQPWVNDLRC